MNEQELFWKSRFGDEYVERNAGREYLAAKIDMFTKATNRLPKFESVIELGANRGLNANALKLLFPEINYTGVEIGDKAFSYLSSNVDVDHSIHCSIHEFETEQKYDLVLIAGVLIHLNPDQLPSVYELVNKLSKRFVLFSEYYNPKPVELDYRGHSGKLFKRDFAGEYMHKYHAKLVDYGFVYSGDPKYKHDDMTWFAMEV